MIVKNRDKLDILLDEIIRMTHNFVASAMSLVDHTRIFYKKSYEKNDRFPDYQAKIDDTFTNDNLVQFVHCLRQYCQHYRSPNISVEESWNQGDQRPKRSIKLLKRDLNTFSGWNSKAKNYLMGEDEKIDLISVIDIYKDKILNFHSWLRKRQGEIHAAEFKVLRDKEKEVLVAQIVMFLNGALKNDRMQYSGEDEIFYGIFTSKDYEELEAYSWDSPARSKRAIELLKQRLDVPEDVIRRIRLWYEKKAQRSGLVNKR